MFLLYPYRNRDITWELIERSRRAGYPALCLMVDVPTVGKRERDLRTGFSKWSAWSVNSILSIARRPGWALGQLRKGPIALSNFVTRGSSWGRERNRSIGELA